MVDPFGFGSLFGKTILETVTTIATGGVVGPASTRIHDILGTGGCFPSTSSGGPARRRSPTPTSSSSSSSDDDDDEVSLEEQNRQARREIEQRRRDMQSLNRRINSLERQMQERPVVSAARRVRTLSLHGNNIGVFGLTSRGKSTLVNSLLNKTVAEVGAGETTKEIKAYPGLGYTIWDVPGQNDMVTYEQDDYMSLIKGLTHRLILIQSTVKENVKLMRLLDDLNLRYDIVVNKFDQVDADEQDGFQRQINREVSSSNLQCCRRVYFVSAKFPNQFGDWLRMVHALTS